MEDAGSWSIVMKDIIGVLKEDSLFVVGLKEHLICEVGDGQNMCFWLDPWADIKPISLQFPMIYAFRSSKTT